jgi:hypothetical protein
MVKGEQFRRHGYKAMDDECRQKRACQMTEKTENYTDRDCTGSHLHTLGKMHERIENKVDRKRRPEAECLEAQKPEYSPEKKFISKQVKNPCPR